MTFALAKLAALSLAFTLIVLPPADPEAAAAQRPTGPIQLELDTDRPGEDYFSFELREANPETCRAACERDNRCRAFTYVNPGVQGRYARCHLKKAAPPKRANRCCVSGVRP